MDAATLERNPETTTTTEAPAAAPPWGGPRLPERFDIARDTLAGDIRDAVLDIVRQRPPKAWADLIKHEQDKIIFAAARIGRNAADAAFDAIHNGNVFAVEATVGKASWGGKPGEFELKITTADSDENMLALKRHKRVIVLCTTPEDYYGEREEAKGEPDQSGLFDGETAEEKEAAEAAAGQQTAPGGLPLDEAQRKLEEAKVAAEERRSKAAADAELAGRTACDAGKERSCPRSSAKYREAWLRGYDKRGLELARQSIENGSSADVVVGLLKKNGITVPYDFLTALPEPTFPERPLEPAE